MIPDLTRTSTTVFQDSVHDQDNANNSTSGDHIEGGASNVTVKLLRKYYILNTIPYLSVSWCYLGNKHVYHIFNLDPFCWLVLFSFGTLYSNVLLTCLVCLFWGCVILYTFQETPTLRNADESNSDTDYSDSDSDEILEADFVQRRPSSTLSSNSVPIQSKSRLRRRPTASTGVQSPSMIDDELRGMFGD